MKRIQLIPVLLLAAASAAQAEVKLHALFTDGAVLQREMPVPVWGTAADGEKVTVTFAGQTATTTAKDGKWEVKLKSLKAGGPHVLTVEGTNKLEVKDVLVGEVWICSGQSNMAFQLQHAHNTAEVVPASANPNIRLFKVPGNPQDEPQRDVKAKWEPCNPQTSPSFSAVGYFFGRDLQKALGVPVGLIGSSVGGTPAQAWTGKPMLESFPVGKEYLDQQIELMKTKDAAEAKHKAAVEAWKAKAAELRAAKKPVVGKAPAVPAFLGSKRPACLYNGMIAPLVPYAVRGAIWYQGEANSGQPEKYRELLPAMIKNWRADFNPDLTFLIVQLAPFDRPAPEAWAYFRETQRQIALKTPKTGLAAIPDAGDPTDIHPTKKEPAGQRLALQALAITYGKDVVSSGPAFKSAVFGKEKATLAFDQVGDGLVAKDGDLTGFLIAGDDKKFVPATAKIVKSKIEVSSPDVKEPKAVRYAWKNMPDGNLWNKAGLPASPFRTDDWPQPEPTPAAKPAPRAAKKPAKPAVQ